SLDYCWTSHSVHTRVPSIRMVRFQVQLQVCRRCQMQVVILAVTNQKQFEWRTEEKTGALKELQQEMQVGGDDCGQQVAAHFQSNKNETDVHAYTDDHRDSHTVSGGLVSLRLVSTR